MKRLDVLKGNTEAVSYAEVVKNALRLYEALIDAEKAGKQFFTRDQEGVFAPFKVLF